MKDVKTALVCLVWILLCCSIPINGQNFEIIHIDAANASTISPRTAQQGFKNFDKQKKKYLKVTPIKVLQVKTEKVCSLRCVAELRCVSYNFASSPSSSGYHQCELLAADMFNNLKDLTNSKIYHHFAMQTKCLSRPCKYNGVCIPNYSSDTYTCQCAKYFSGKHCETVIDPVCSSYTNITDGTRNVNHQTVTAVKNENTLAVKWYRLTGASGSRMPTSCVPIYRCDTDAPGWLSDPHPTVEQGILSRMVCFHWDRNCCYGKYYIRVRNCGSFYVYEFQPLISTYRYCGTD